MSKALTSLWTEILATTENVPVSLWQKKSAICLDRTQLSDQVSTNFRIENKYGLETNHPLIKAIQTILGHSVILEPISKLFEVLDTIPRVRHYTHSDFTMRISKDTLGHYHSSRMTKGDVTRKPGGGGGGGGGHSL